MPTLTPTVADVDSELKRVCRLLAVAVEAGNLESATAHWKRLDHLLDQRTLASEG